MMGDGVQYSNYGHAEQPNQQAGQSSPDQPKPHNIYIRTATHLQCVCVWSIIYSLIGIGWVDGWMGGWIRERWTSLINHHDIPTCWTIVIVSADRDLLLNHRVLVS
jgi:hypothetical protein